MKQVCQRLALCGLALAACAPARPVRVLVAGSNLQHPPFSSRGANGKPVGLEVEIVEAAARQLGATVRWVERPFGELLAAIEAGEIDVAVSTIGITEERRRRVAFSRAYHETEIVALVRRDPSSARSLGELEQRTIGADEGTTAYPAARSRWPSATLVGRVRDGMTWPEMLEQGLIDAFVVDASDQARLESASGIPMVRIHEPLAAEYFGVALAHGDDALQLALDRAIEKHGRTRP